MRVSDNARNCVVFFGGPTPESPLAYSGTGFLVLYKESDITSCYLVTAAHVARRIDPGSDIVLRVNLKAGGSEPFPVEDVVWSIHSDKNVDVAATPCYLDPNVYEVNYISVTEQFVQDNSPAHPFWTRAGDPISIVGLFRLHSGSKRNAIIVHSGNIALMPNVDEKIPVRDRVTNEPLEMEAYLVEAQTLDGLSGAPVFHREMVSASVLGQHNGGPAIVATGLMLLGVYSSSWDGEPETALAKDRKLQTGKKVPVGMGIVVPCQKLMELIMTDDKLKKHREDMRRRKMEEFAATTDDSFMIDSSPLPSADNSNHREDFMRLASAAARKQKPTE